MMDPSGRLPTLPPPCSGLTRNLCCISFLLSPSLLTLSFICRQQLWSSKNCDVIQLVLRAANAKSRLWHFLTAVCQSQCCRIGSRSHRERTAIEMFTGGLSLVWCHPPALARWSEMYRDPALSYYITLSSWTSLNPLQAINCHDRFNLSSFLPVAKGFFSSITYKCNRILRILQS